MIKAVLIDDEKDARFLLRSNLELGFKDSVEILGEADDVDAGVEAIKQYRPDLVFLDIQMPQGTGFDLLQKFDNINFEVIFVTAYNDYALRAFEFSAFGYLMKPIKSTHLEQVISKYKAHRERYMDSTDKRLKVLIENYDDDNKVKKLVISNVDGFQVVELESIFRLEGDRNYTNFIIKGGRKITSSKTLGDYDELLKDHGFFRIHQSTLINLKYVQGFVKGDGGMVEMTDGTSHKLSRHRKAEFMKRFI